MIARSTYSALHTSPGLGARVAEWALHPVAPEPTAIAGTAYDTAWLASLPADGDTGRPRFPAALQWLLDHQLPDGSWGGPIRYEPDRVLSTLAALVALAAFAPRAQAPRIAAGTRYLWQHGHILAREPIEPVGFELLLPALVQRARVAGVAVPPHLDVYAEKRLQKLRLIPPAALYSSRTTAVHSLEFLGEQADVERLRAAQGVNGSLGNSPAATAYFVALTGDRRALAYLEDTLRRSGGSTVPVLHPCETFELLWAAYHLYLGGTPAADLLDGQDRRALLRALAQGGVSLSPDTFPVADADDTAVALLLLHELGETVDPNVLRSFATPDGHFASFPHERHSSVGVNLHVLHALLRVPGYHGLQQAVQRILAYLVEQQAGGLYWTDKWHISPYYATSHALRVLAELPAPAAALVAAEAERAREWIRQTQNADGTWGYFGAPTAEETAYAVLALTAGGADRMPSADRRRCLEAQRSLRTALALTESAGEHLDPPLWVDKCLYTPTVVVRSVLEAARAACAVDAGMDAPAAPAVSPRPATRSLAVLQPRRGTPIHA